jgi:energy-coupling factor transport system permease protein
MRDRLSFYIPRASRLHSLNPLTKLLLTFTMIILAFISPWYWTAAILVVAVLLPLMALAKVLREYLLTALRLLIPAIGFIFVMQSLFANRPGDLLFQIWFIEVTDANVSFAFLITSRIFVMISSFLLFLFTTHPSQLMSDLTRRKLPGTFSYVVISTLQILPFMQAKAQTIIAAQRSRGLDTESSVLKRIQALVPLVGPLVLGSLVEVEERAIAIEARGFSSPLPKTSLHEIPDTTADKMLRWLMVAVILLIFASRLWPF